MNYSTRQHHQKLRAICTTLVLAWLFCVKHKKTIIHTYSTLLFFNCCKYTYILVSYGVCTSFCSSQIRDGMSILHEAVQNPHVVRAMEGSVTHTACKQEFPPNEIINLTAENVFNFRNIHERETQRHTTVQVCYEGGTVPFCGVLYLFFGGGVYCTFLGGTVPFWGGYCTFFGGTVSFWGGGTVLPFFLAKPWLRLLRLGVRFGLRARVRVIGPGSAFGGALFAFEG